MTVIVPLRSGGKGIAGTYANAHHHAQAILPFIEALEKIVPTLGFKKWKQGNNVHILVTGDGRQFEVIPVARYNNGGYVGLRLRLHVSRSQRLALQDLTDMRDLPSFITTLQYLAKPMDPTIQVGGGVKREG